MRRCLVSPRPLFCSINQPRASQQFRLAWKSGCFRLANPWQWIVLKFFEKALATERCFENHAFVG